MTKKTEKVLALTMKERVILPSILPAQGDKLTQIVVRSLIEKSEFSQAEIRKFEMAATGESVTWNKSANSAKFDIPITDAEAQVLKDTAKQLDKDKKVTQHNLGLLEKIEAL